MQNNSIKKDGRFTDEDLKLWDQWLPKGYEEIVKNELKYSINYIQRVKKGKRYNVQIMTLLNNLANQNKKKIENFTA
jgi:hypothetical protein